MRSDDGPPPGVLIVFEGGEGSGKTTQSGHLAARLRATGRRVRCTREPGGTPRAEQLRAMILAGDEIDPRVEALLFAAARADHAAQLIRPALAAGEVVLCDRYIDSSVAYQGVARGLGADRVRDLSLWATGGLMPHRTIVLDLDPAVGLPRALDRNRLESEPPPFHEAVRKAFLSLAAADPAQYRVIDASGHADAIADQVWQAVSDLVATP